jgi:hypothetical protein
MTIQNQAIFDAALALPEAERALLVERLFDSLSPEPGELTDDEFTRNSSGAEPKSSKG